MIRTAATTGGAEPAALDRRLAAAALAVALLAPDALVSHGPTLCLFRRATGLPCPTCGLTRSIHSAGRLRVRDSVAYHPLGIPALGAAALMATGRWRPSSGDPRPSPVLLAAAAVWLATWAIRVRSDRAAVTLPATAPSRPAG